ncbi:MAG: heme o synthase [candidate division Zixibacteria bacterium]|nr:heme o synthase [candidate division Zixibacteria bacterium]
MALLSKLSSFINLTKPRIMLLVGVTGATGLFMEGSLLSDPLRFSLAMLALLLAGGSANAFNQYFEREIDAKMERTKARRPLPLHQIHPWQALEFSIVIGAAAIVIFTLEFNLLSSLLSAATILFYGLFYTLWLKPRTHLNIVIGGAAGAMAPLITWAAASGSLTWEPVVLFLIIFFWTPAHFWALALCFKEDYKKVGLPMLPNVKGDKETVRQIVLYTFWTVAFSLLLLISQTGWLYFVAAVASGIIFIAKVADLRKHPETKVAYGVFGYSIVYLFVLFVALAADSIFYLKI